MQIMKTNTTNDATSRPYQTMDGNQAAASL